MRPGFQVIARLPEGVVSIKKMAQFGGSLFAVDDQYRLWVVDEDRKDLTLVSASDNPLDGTRLWDNS